MIQCGNWPVGVCSWSLQTDVSGVVSAMDKLGIEHVHLAGPAVGRTPRPIWTAITKQSWIVVVR